MTQSRSDAVLALTDAIVADPSRLSELINVLSFWPVFRQNVWRRLLQKAEPILTCSDRDYDKRSLILCLEAVIALCSPCDRFVCSIVDLPHVIVMDLVSMMSPSARSVLVSGLKSDQPDLADEIAFRFDCAPGSPEPDAVSCESVQLPYSPHWVAALLGQPSAVIRTVLVELHRQCRDDVFWKTAVDQLLAYCDHRLLNLLCIWNIAGVRQVVSERKLLRSPTQQVLSSIGLSEDDSLGNSGRLFSRARRKSSEFIVRPERFAIELETFLRLQDPPANQLELAASVLASLVKYPNQQLRKQIVSALLPHVPLRCSIEAFEAVCRELSPSESNTASAVTLITDTMARCSRRSAWLK